MTTHQYLQYVPHRHTRVHHLLPKTPLQRATPRIELGTSSTRKTNHTTRPSGPAPTFIPTLKLSFQPTPPFLTLHTSQPITPPHPSPSSPPPPSHTPPLHLFSPYSQCSASQSFHSHTREPLCTTSTLPRPVKPLNRFLDVLNSASFPSVHTVFRSPHIHPPLPEFHCHRRFGQLSYLG